MTAGAKRPKLELGSRNGADGAVLRDEAEGLSFPADNHGTGTTVRTCAAPAGGSVYQDPQNWSDHRRYPRLICEGIADVRVLPNGEKETGAILNVSKRGCCFLADEAVRGIEGSSIEVHFKVRGIDLRLGGIIRHIHKRRRAGIEFVQLTERKRDQIDELIAELYELSRAAGQAHAASCRLHEKQYHPDAG